MMTSFSGYISYLKFTYGSNKGGIVQRQVIADPWAVHPRTDDNMRYTSQAVVEPVETNATYTPAWTPVIKGGIVNPDDGVAYDAKFIADDDGTVTYINATDGTFNITEKGKLAYRYDNAVIPQNDLPIINMEWAGIALQAKPRRVAIYFK